MNDDVLRLRNLLLRKNKKEYKGASESIDQLEYAMTDEACNSLRTIVGVTSQNYETTNDIYSNVQSISTSGFIRIVTNDRGFAEVIINPNFLISSRMLTGISKSASANISNVFVANDDGYAPGEFTRVVSLKSTSITPYDFDTYKFQKIEIRQMPELAAKEGHVSTNDVNILENQIKIQMVDGKSINVLGYSHQLFKNRLLNRLLGVENLVTNSFEYNCNDPLYYSMNAISLGDVKYNKNGCNSADETALSIITPMTNIKQLSARMPLKYSKYLAGLEDYSFTNDYTYLTNIVNFVKSIFAKGETQDCMYNQTNQKNERVIRIIIHAMPYQAFNFQVNTYYTVKANSLIDFYEVEKAPAGYSIHEDQLRVMPVNTTIKPLGSSSNFEKNENCAMNILAASKASTDGAAFCYHLYGESRLRGPGFNKWFDDLWEQAREASISVVNSVEHVVNKVSSVIDTVKAVLYTKKI
jgi:hypothetical protein